MSETSSHPDRDFALAAGFDRIDGDPRPISEIPKQELLEGFVWLEPTDPEPLSGEERFGDSGLTVRDYWVWAHSDLRHNVDRGVLAEFLVAKAVGDTNPVRHGWSNWDVTAPDGIRIEVKSSAYLQSWKQRRLSRIVFTGLTARRQDYETLAYEDEPSLGADVYVFAVQTEREPAAYDMVDLDAWRFYVVPVEVLRELATSSVSLATLERLGFQPVHFEQLAVAVREAAGTGR